jgi:hypothetical protein
MVPFIILGVGLDDTFIITGAYFRRLRLEHAQEVEQQNEAAEAQAAQQQLKKGQAWASPRKFSAAPTTSSCCIG